MILLRWHCTGFFSCTMLSGVSWATWHRFLPVQCCPKIIATLLNRIFSYAMLSWASWTTLHKVFTCACNFVTGVLREHWTIFFPCNVVWSLLDNLVFLVTLCNVVLRIIKTTLKDIFPVQYCLQHQGQYYIGFFLWTIISKALRQHCTWFFPVQYYLQPFGQYCARLLPVQCCPKSITTTLNKMFSMQCCLDSIA